MEKKTLKEKFLKKIFRKFRIDPLLFAYNQIGILKWQNDDVSGENFFINDVLFKKNVNNPQPVFFDVGANVGRYSENLLKTFSKAKVHSFEPLPSCIYKLNKLSDLFPDRIVVNEKCLSNEETSLTIATYPNDLESEHASIYGDVIKTIHKSAEVEIISVTATTVDKYCEEKNISYIDLLKIDTEGHEYKVLAGAKRMLENKKIAVIQFEFNEMNVISRTFFKDFYDLLNNDYNLYRLNSDRLEPIVNYDSYLEVFKFQNFIAVNKSAL